MLKKKKNILKIKKKKKKFFFLCWRWWNWKKKFIPSNCQILLSFCFQLKDHFLQKNGKNKKKQKKNFTKKKNIKMDKTKSTIIKLIFFFIILNASFSQISSCSELMSLINASPNGNFTLTQDINCTITPFIPIASVITPFTGNLNGKEKRFFFFPFIYYLILLFRSWIQDFWGEHLITIIRCWNICLRKFMHSV